MEVQYVHVKTRSQFGKQCIFSDDGPIVDENIIPDPELMNDYIYRNPCNVAVQNSKQYAVHEAQTTSTPMRENGMCHTEGGWPKEMNPRDEEVTARFRRRVEKEDIWPIKMKKLLGVMERYILQNNSVNIYENFFDDMVMTELVLPLDVRTVNAYEDPHTPVRPITHLSWSPDRGKRLAVSYCSREFVAVSIQRDLWSYIWEVENPNKPLMALKAICPSVTIEFNPRDPSMLISGLMSGQVCNWDIRHGDTPVQMSHLQFSHRNPTNLALWINSKTNTEFFSASTDGGIKWWDLRNLREPTESLVMDLENPLRGDFVRAIGVSSLHYEPTMGTKFLAGMENGTVINGTRKGKNAQEKLAMRFSCHAGPIVALDRNPFSTKNFLTVGGFVARIWAEDTREGNLVSINRGKTKLNGGCWSTSRYSVFHLIDQSGVMKIYDLLVGLKAPVKSIRLCEHSLTAIRPHENGDLVAVGSEMGKVYLVESSEGLTSNARNDKFLTMAVNNTRSLTSIINNSPPDLIEALTHVFLAQYLDRCSRYVKAVDNRLREMRLIHRMTVAQADESVISTTDREKEPSKDTRVKDVHHERKSIEEKVERRGKMKLKKAKEPTVSVYDEPEFEEAQSRYFEIVNKEMEKYAEIAALVDEQEEEKEDVGDEDDEDESVKSQKISPTPRGGELGARRKNKHEDSRLEREHPAIGRRHSGSDAERNNNMSSRRRKSRAGGKPTRSETTIEEIVLVRKSELAAEKEAAHQLLAASSSKMNDLQDESDLMPSAGDYEAVTPTKYQSGDLKKAIKPRKQRYGKPRDIFRKSSGKSKKRGFRGVIVKTGKPCLDYVCRPSICCLDQIARMRRERGKKKKGEQPVTTLEKASDTKIMIKEMLANLPKIASPEELGHLLDPIDEADRIKRLALVDKDARPSFLDEKLKMAKRGVRQYREAIRARKFTRMMKLQRKIVKDEIQEIFSESERDEKVEREDSRKRESDEISQASSGSPDIQQEDEFTSEREDYARTERKLEKRKKVKVPLDCEPISVQFGEKEIKRIIGIPDAPTPPSQPKFDESRIKVTKTRGDYPRISAAAIPKLQIKKDDRFKQ